MQLFERRVIGVNGTWPMPVLVADKGDKHIIHATNSLGDDNIPTALHAHGMFFNNSAYWDGATGVTQCGIPNGQTLDYEIDLSRNQGTYWVHGHYNGQYVDGLRTVSIIRNPRPDNLTWDDEYTLAVADWYHRQHQDMLDNDFLHWTNPTGAEPVPESALMYVIDKDGNYLGGADKVTDGSVTNDNAKIPFEAGKTYRIRIVNMAALSMFMVKFQDHDMYVIETDGVECEPYPIDVVTISVAQRFSILVKAKEKPTQNYGIAVYQSEDMYDVVPPELVLNNTVTLEYFPDQDRAEEFVIEEYPLINDTEFRPVEKIASAKPDVEFTIHAYFDTFNDGTNRASFTQEGGFQNVTYRSPQVPSIFTAMSMGEDAFKPEVYGQQTGVITYKHMDMIQLTVHNWDAGFHPFHLHGHEFMVIEKSFNVSSDDPVENPPILEDQENPARRDTITIPPEGKVVLRWRADNPGVWFFHCHIDWHLSSGLAMVFVEAPDVMQKNFQIPAQMYDHCKIKDIPTTGNVVGKNSTSDMEGQETGPQPLVMGWTPKAKGVMAACVITVLIGLATIIWYGAGELNEEELEEEVRRAVEAKQNKVPIWKKALGGKQAA